MLNRLIRLQAVVEKIVNLTGDALGLVARQNTKMRTAIYQNGLALDYLLAQEGGVCGKF
ncbi:ENR1 protein, partial [Corythaeola cristata]|nr:ENR1 protein [Corythaeola cristata]